MTPHPTERVCVTQGCWTYTRKKQKYCLACQLDRQIPQPPMDRQGRPSRIIERVVEHVGQCALAMAECPTCEQALLLVSDGVVHDRLAQVWEKLDSKRRAVR